MPHSRETLNALQTPDGTDTPDTQLREVLSLLARTPDSGYEPKEIASKTHTTHTTVYPILNQLQEGDLVEKLAGHYLINRDKLTTIQNDLLTSEQLAVAADISDTNTAPDTIETTMPTSPPDDALNR